VLEANGFGFGFSVELCDASVERDAVLGDEIIFISYWTSDQYTDEQPHGLVVAKEKM